MTGASQIAGKAENRSAIPVAICGAALMIVLAALLHALGVSLIVFALLLGSAALVWMMVRHPVASLGIVLAAMPVYPLAFLLGKFFGPSFVASLAGADRVALLLLVFILWWRNGIRLTAPDWFLLVCFALAVVRLAFGGMVIALLSDFNFMIAYAVGRMAALSSEQENRWAKRAVWIVGILSLLGLSEVFILGAGPRTALYLAVAEGATDRGGLAATFSGEGLTALRESATMFGPIQFASLCMVALIVWWVYSRNRWIAGMVATGLIGSVTRSAWLGTALALPVLAVLMDQTRRLLIYGVLGLALFAASIPVLGLGDYLVLAKTGQDYSTVGHSESLLAGVGYVLDHPLGAGPGNAGSYATRNDMNGVFIENTYLTLAAEYGIATSLCFLGFLFSALRVAWRERTQLGYTAVGILVGFGAVMFVAPLHQDFSLASWIWFPVGLAVRPR